MSDRRLVPSDTIRISRTSITRIHKVSDPESIIDRLMSNRLTRAVSRVIDRNWADRGPVRYLGQELILVGHRR